MQVSVASYIDPDRWRQHTPEQSGSWWPRWAEWLEEGQQQRNATMIRCDDSELPPAPGEYVLIGNDMQATKAENHGQPTKADA